MIQKASPLHQDAATFRHFLPVGPTHFLVTRQPGTIFPEMATDNNDKSPMDRLLEKANLLGYQAALLDQGLCG